MSFGALQRAFAKRCVRLMVEGKEAEAKIDLREFIDYLKTKQPLIEQFYVYESLTNHTENDKDLAIMFIKETLQQLNTLSRGDILTFNTLLKHKFNLKEDITPVDEAINLLIEATVSPFNYEPSRTATAFKVLLNHVMSEKTNQQPIKELLTKQNQFGDANLDFFTPRQVVRIAIKKFNTEFGPLFTETERVLFKRLHSCSSEESLVELYESEYTGMLNDVNKFKAGTTLDEDIVRNIDLAIVKLKGQCSVDNLLNIVELRTHIADLGVTR